MPLEKVEILPLGEIPTEAERRKAEEELLLLQQEKKNRRESGLYELGQDWMREGANGSPKTFGEGLASFGKSIGGALLSRRYSPGVLKVTEAYMAANDPNRTPRG